MPVIRNCGVCSSKNRVPARHIADTGRCGVCKSPLPPVSEPIDADQALFDEMLRESPVPILTDFWASWCGPCRMAAPEVHALAKEMAGKAVVMKVNTEEQQGLAARYGIQSIPNFMVFRGGRPVFQQAGAVPRAEMRRWLESTGAGA